jgi:hypothetical protein
MEMKVDKYTAHFSAVPLLSGGFVGLATLVWNEADATLRQTREFFNEFATAAEAEKHAREQTLLRRRATVLPA